MKRTGLYGLPSMPAEVKSNTESSQTRNAVASTTTGQPQLIPLNGEVRVRRFLDAIREDFIANVDILESDLQDHLVQSGVLTQQDSESLQAGHLPTRGERARHLWKLLSSIDHEVVAEKVAPVLVKLFAHIIPARFWVLPHQPHASGECGSSGDDDNYKRCTRCAMQARLRPTTVADFLYKIGAIHRDLYKDVTSNQRLRPTDWPQLFSAFTHLTQHAATHHGGDMTSLLQRHSLSVPSELVDLMTKGFPCTCAPSGKDLMLNTLGRLDSRHPSDASSASSTSICVTTSAHERKELSDLRHVLRSLEMQSPAMTHPSQLPSRTATTRGRRATTKRTIRKAYSWYGPHRPKEPDLQPEGDDFSAETLTPSHGTTGNRLPLVDNVLREIDDARSLADDEITESVVQAEEDGYDEVSDTTQRVSETQMLDSQVSVTPPKAGGGLPDSQISVAPAKASVLTPSGTVGTPSTRAHHVPGTGYVASLVRKMNADSVDVHTNTNYADAKAAVCPSAVGLKPKPPIALRTNARACNTIDTKTQTGAVVVQKQTEDADRLAKTRSHSNQKQTDSVDTQTKAKSAVKSDSLDVVGVKRRSDPVAKTSKTKPSDFYGLDGLQRHSDPFSEMPRSLKVIKGTEEEPTVLFPTPPLSMSRQSSRESSPLASPLKLLPSDSSLDGDKYKQFVKAIDKGDFEKRRPILFGAVSNDQDDVRTHGDIFLFPEVDNPLSNSTDYREETDDAAPVDTISPSQSPKGTDSTDYDHEGPDHFTRHAVEQAIKNSDVEQFRDTVANDVNTTKKLTRLLKKAIIRDPSARTELRQLLENHRDIDSIYNGIVGRLKTLIAINMEEMTQSASRGDDVLDDVVQLCREVLEMCLDILLSTRMFLICAVYLNSDVTTTSSRVRDTTDRFIRDVMVLQQVTRMEAWRGVQRLDELIDEWQGGVASCSTGLEQVIPLLASFLDRS